MTYDHWAVRLLPLCLTIVMVSGAVAIAFA